MAQKITKKDNYLKLKSMITDKDLIAFIDNEIALLEKKNGAKKSPTKNQLENANLKDNIISVMYPDEKYSVTDIMAAVGIPSNQRATALLTQLVNENKIIRIVEKRKPYFTLA